MRVLYLGLSAAAVGIMACSSQNGVGSLEQGPPTRRTEIQPSIERVSLCLKGPQRRCLRRATQTGTPYNLAGSRQCGVNATYCYGWEPGDSVTFPVHVVVSESQAFRGCYQTANIQQSTQPTPMVTPLVETINPPTYNPSGLCNSVITVYSTVTYIGQIQYDPGISSTAVICCGIVGIGIQSLEGYTYVGYPSHPPATPLPTPSPGIDIFDFNINKIVTNTMQTAVVGQAELLQAVISQPGETLSNCNWTIGGNIVGGYTPNGSSPLPAPTSNAQETYYYWIGSGQNNASANEGVAVSCTASPGGSVTASATYGVQQPTVNTNSVLFGSNATAYNNGYLIFPGVWAVYATGPSPSPSPGVNWTYAVSNVPSSGAGQIGLIQLANIINTAVVPSPAPTTTVLYTTGNVYCVDASPTPFIYPPGPASSTWFATDAPAQPIPTPANSFKINEQYQDYYMYGPKNDNVGSSIWVTLASGTWKFVTNGSKNLAGMFGLSGTNVGGSAPSATAALPTWACQINESARRRGAHKSQPARSGNVNLPPFRVKAHVLYR
jgi:hypothetical protein